MEISKRDTTSIIKYLGMAAGYFDSESRQLYIAGVSGARMADAARCMRRLAKKLEAKMKKQ